MTPATGPCPLCRAIVHGATVDGGVFVPNVGPRHAPTCIHYRKLWAGLPCEPSNPVVVRTIALLEVLRGLVNCKPWIGVPTAGQIAEARQHDARALLDAVDFEQLDHVIERWKAAADLFDRDPAMRHAIASAIVSAVTVEDLERKPGGGGAS